MLTISRQRPVKWPHLLGYYCGSKWGRRTTVELCIRSARQSISTASDSNRVYQRRGRGEGSGREGLECTMYGTVWYSMVWHGMV